jgi:hypothetical protein
MIHVTIINGDCKGKYAPIAFAKVDVSSYAALTEVAFLLAHLRRGSKAVLSDDEGNKWYYYHNGGVPEGNV